MPTPILLSVPVVVFLILVIWAIMAGNKGRLTDVRLIMLGVFLIVTALLFESAQTSAYLSGSPQPVPNLPGLTGPSGAGLTRAGVLLVLAGVVSYLWKGADRPEAPVANKEAPRGF